MFTFPSGSGVSRDLVSVYGLLYHAWRIALRVQSLCDAEWPQPGGAIDKAFL